MKIILAVLFITLFAKAESCTNYSQLKFGDKVKIINSTYSEYQDLDFVKGLTGIVINRYRTKYNDSCSDKEVIQVNVCTKDRDCNDFSFCARDLVKVK